MTLTPGTRLGPYEVLDELGAGGMGVVYKGRDPRLGREVAIKVLAPSFAADADRLKRFEQEARAAGSLNHPNVLTVFDVGSHESGPYLVTELLQGETLRLRLAAGPLPPPQAIDMGRQIAEGLAAAHAKGIVHRDLKPENLFITRDGRIKILDFGLAKLVRSPLTNVEVSRTIPAQSADSGSISGTAGYMSPEQVRGEHVDHRSDLFALGAILHEALSGTRIFGKESMFGTFEAIVKEDPPPLSPELLASYPILEKVLNRCLEKTLERRFQSAADLAFTLGIQSAPRPKPVGAPHLPTSAPVPAFRRLTYRRGSIFSARFAADGSTVVYSGRYEGKPPEVFTVQTGFPESRPLGLDGTELFSVSPHGELAVGLSYRHVGAFVSAGVLARVPMGVGSPRELEEDIFLAEWGPGADDLIVVRDVGGTMRIEFPLGNVLFETAGWVGGVRLSPDGTQMAFINHPIRGNDEGTIDLLSFDGNRRVLSTGWKSIWGLSWTPDGREILFGASQLPFGRDIQAVSIDGRHRVVLQSPGSLTMLDVSKGGEILFTRGTERMGIMVKAAGESVERELSWLDWSLVRDISEDGRWILFDESGEGAVNTPTIYMRRVDGSPAVRLAPGLAMEFTSDRKWVLGLSVTDRQILLVPTGTGATRTYPLGPIQCHSAKWFPDESRIMFAGNEPGGSLREFALDPKTGAIEPISQEGVQLEVFITPDAQHLVYPGPNRTYALFPLGGGPAKPLPNVQLEDRPALFSKDGKTVFLYQRGLVPSRLDRLDLETGHREIIQELRPPELAGVFSISPVRVTHDGSAYAYSFASLLHDLYIARGFI